MNATSAGLRVFFLTVVSLAWAAAPARAQPRPVSLAMLEQQALSARQNLSAQQARIRRAAAETDRRASASHPSVTLANDVTLSPGGALEHVAAFDLDPIHEILVQGYRTFGDADAFAAQGRYSSTLVITKNLYDFGRTTRAIEAARAEELATGAEEQVVRRQVLDDVRASYFSWLAATELAAISERAVVDAQARRKFVTDLVAEGAKPAADISPVATDEALARLEASRSRAEVERARLKLDAAIGGGLPADAVPDRSALQMEQPGPLDGERASDAGVVALERQRDAARATASMYDLQHLPTIGALAEFGVRAQTPIGGAGLSGVFPVYRAGVSLSVPLSDGGSGRANARIARAQAEEFEARAREAAQAWRTARGQAEADAAAAQERLQVARELLALSERRASEADARYREAGGPIEAIADANAMRRRAHTEIALSEIAVAQARYALQSR